MKSLHNFIDWWDYPDDWGVLRKLWKLGEPRGLHDPVTVGLEDISEGRKRSRRCVSKSWTHFSSPMFQSCQSMGGYHWMYCRFSPVIAKYRRTITTGYGCKDRCICNPTFLSIASPTCYIPVWYNFLTLSSPHSHCFASKNSDHQSEIPERGKEWLLFSKFEIHTY